MPTINKTQLPRPFRLSWITVIMSIAMILFPTVVFAHPGHSRIHGFEDGFVHPLTGLDHCCAMIGIGIWAAQIGGRALWLGPLTAIAFTILGGSLGMKIGVIPFIEHGIVSSILVLGLLIAITRKLPLPAVLAIIGLFATIHGFAHGMELPRSTDKLAYGMGILLSSLTLQVVGMATTLFVLKLNQQRIVQFSGALITLCGVILFFQQ